MTNCYVPLKRRFRDSQIDIIINFVVVSNVGIERVVRIIAFPRYILYHFFLWRECTGLPYTAVVFWKGLGVPESKKGPTRVVSILNIAEYYQEYSLLLCGLSYSVVLYLTLCYFVLVFCSPFSIAITRLVKRKLMIALFVRLFHLCLFGFVGFLFLLVSGKGCGLWLWYSLDFSLTFFFSFFFFTFPWPLALVMLNKLRCHAHF